jgi:hypothetical protein
MIIILLNILVIVSCVFIYTTVNLLKKNEQLEDITIKQQQILDNLSQDIFYCEQRIQELDTLGAFKSDDEIGWFFKEVKNMSDKLKQYILN